MQFFFVYSRFKNLETRCFKNLETRRFKNLETRCFKNLETRCFKNLETRRAAPSPGYRKLSRNPRPPRMTLSPS